MSMNSYASRTVESARLQADVEYVNYLLSYPSIFRYAPEQMLFRLDADQLRTMDVTARIVRTSNQFLAGGGFGDVYKCMYMSDGEQIEVCVVS